MKKKSNRKLVCISILSLFLLESAIADKTIHLASAEHEPYIGKNLPARGYVFELVSSVFKRAGYKIKIDFYPLARAKNLAKLGKVDGFIPSYYNPSLSSIFHFSDPFPGDRVGLLKKKSMRVPKNNEGKVEPSKIMLEPNDFLFGTLIGANLDSKLKSGNKLSEVTQDSQNILMLANDRIDFAIIDKYTAADIMVMQFPHLIGQLEFINPPLLTKQFHIAFSKKSKDYLQHLKTFNRGLQLLTKNGDLENILLKHGLLPPQVNIPGKTKLRIGTVNNRDMLVMQSLSKNFLNRFPNITLEWRVMEEDTLRKRLLSDLAISDGQFDIVTIGSFEAPIWAKRGWLTALTSFPATYDIDDLLQPIRDSLSYQGRLYALPFYGESSMTYYRQDIFEKMGIQMPEVPTYSQIKEFAAKIHAPERQFYAVCLRGQAGWGANMTYFNTLLNTFGGRWFDSNWNTTIDTQEWYKALSLYKELLIKYGPPSALANNFNENLRLFANGHCGMWIDSTVAAGMLYNPQVSKVWDKLGFASAPVGITEKGSHWLWAWSLAIPKSSKVAKQALEFITWATSKEYINLVVKTEGVLSVPPGTRRSTYQNSLYQEQAPFANFVFKAIQEANPTDNTLKPSPYNGIQFVGIPEFPAIGHQVGLEIFRVMQGKNSIHQALKNSQKLVSKQIIDSGYIK